MRVQVVLEEYPHDGERQGAAIDAVQIAMGGGARKRQALRQVQSYTLRCIRTTELSAANFESAAAAVVEVLAADSSLTLRVQAALALGWFVDASGVLAELGRTIADPNAPLDWRHAAFNSWERVGLTAESISLLNKLQADELLWPTAQSTLVSWRVPQESD
jgi:hypothetical protein